VDNRDWKGMRAMGAVDLSRGQCGSNLATEFYFFFN
jgi:hypothetical protein